MRAEKIQRIGKHHEVLTKSKKRICADELTRDMCMLYITDLSIQVMCV